MQHIDDLQIETVQNEARFYELAEKWRALSVCTGSDFGYFQSFDWCATWWKHAGTRQPETILNVSCLWQKQKLVAVWPLMRDRGKLATNLLVPLTHPHFEYSNLLADPEHVTEAQLAEFVAVTLKLENLDMVSVPKIPEGTQLFSAIGQRGDVAPTDEIASIFDLSEFTNFDQTQTQLTKNNRKRRKQRRKKLEKVGAVSYRAFWGNSKEYKDLVSRAFAFKQIWLAETGRNDSKFLVEGYQDCIAALPGDEVTRQGAVAGVLELDGEPVAIEIGFVEAAHYYAYIGAFDWTRRDLSVGKIQMEETLSWAIDSNIEKYDLLAEPANYKDSWSNHRVNLTSRVITNSVKGKLIGRYWQHYFRPFVKEQFNNLPSGLRTKLLNARKIGSPAKRQD